MKKTIKKRAFVSAIAMLIVSAIVLTSSTFAWFSMSKEATIEKMDLTVTSPEGIQISANASAWTANLDVADLFPDSKSTSRYKAYDGNINLNPKDLAPVSSGLSSYDSNGYAIFFKATLNDAKVASIKTLKQDEDYKSSPDLVAFDLFFKVAEDTTVYFDSSSFEDTSDSKILTALRVGFQPLGNTTSTVAADAIALKQNSNSKIYEVDSENRSDDAAEVGSGPQATYVINSENAAGRVNNDFVLVNSFTSVASTVRNTADKTAKSFNLKAGISKYRIFIWVEGNDIDCRNSVAGAALSVALKFTID